MVTRGWQLVDYDWDPDTGLGSFVYERTREDTGEIQEKRIGKEQKTWRVPGMRMKF